MLPKVLISFVIKGKTFEQSIMIYTIIVMLFKPQKEVCYDLFNEACVSKALKNRAKKRYGQNLPTRLVGGLYRDY